MWDGELSWRKLSVTGAVILALALVGTVAGAFIVPSLADSLPGKANPLPPIVRPSTETPEPTATPTATVSPRPFEEWARPLAAKLSIPQVALESYGYAEWVLQQTRPTCKLQWTTLAAIGKLATDHGRGSPSAGSRPIIGPALNGSGQPKVSDTDGGALDSDSTWDHAVGMLQMLPSMWRVSGVDANNDNLADPQDVADAALSAGYFLCSSNKDLSDVANWKAAVGSYHAMQVDKVFEVAQDYGVKSKA